MEAARNPVKTRQKQLGKITVRNVPTEVNLNSRKEAASADVLPVLVTGPVVVNRDRADKGAVPAVRVQVSATGHRAKKQTSLQPRKKGVPKPLMIVPGMNSVKASGANKKPETGVPMKTAAAMKLKTRRMNRLKLIPIRPGWQSLLQPW